MAQEEAPNSPMGRNFATLSTHNKRSLGVSHIHKTNAQDHGACRPRVAWQHLLSVPILTQEHWPAGGWSEGPAKSSVDNTSQMVEAPVTTPPSPGHAREQLSIPPRHALPLLLPQPALCFLPSVWPNCACTGHPPPGALSRLLWLSLPLPYVCLSLV